MSGSLEVTDVTMHSAGADGVAAGLLGWVACTVNGSLRLDGITLRRTLEGRITLSFPVRRDRSGREQPYIRPLDRTARREIEHQIFRALGLFEAGR